MRYVLQVALYTNILIVHKSYKIVKTDDKRIDNVK